MNRVYIYKSLKRTTTLTLISLSARKKQADKLKKMSSVKTDSCETDSVAEDGNKGWVMKIQRTTPVIIPTLTVKFD